jgi:hypothetical protein
MTGFRFAGAGVNFTVGVLVQSMETLGIAVACVAAVFGIGLNHKRCFSEAARTASFGSARHPFWIPSRASAL